jgi:penicillin amidase
MRLFSVLLSLILIPAGFAADAPDDLMTRAKAVLARIEGEITVPGLKEPVEVLRDRHGVPHIYACNQDDLFFAQGFVTAQDRLFQMDWWRRVADGEMAEVLGKAGIEADRFARLVKYRGDMDAEWAGYGPDAKRIATAFTRGINACIDSIGERLPIEFQIIGHRPGKWKPEDCLGRMAGLAMIRNFTSEVARAELIATVGIEKARLLAPTAPDHDFAPVPGLDLAGIDHSILQAYRAAIEPAKFRASDGDGSNNWVVDGMLSASGKPLLASDPHRALALPSLRYLVHLHAPGWNVIGSGEPAFPGVAIGHNEHVAWGITIVGTDQSDLYVEETMADDPARFRSGERWEKMTIVRETVRVKGEARPVEVELRFTRHGPIIHQDLKRRRAYALRWVGAEPGTAGYLGSLLLDRAKNAKDVLSAAEAWRLPSENIVFADVEGNIGWIAAAQTPIRKGWNGLLPVPGAEGKYEWQGFLKTNELPQLLNPPSHHVVTANHNILPANYKHEIGHEFAMPYRFDVLRQQLDAKKKFTLHDFEAMQHEVTSLPGRRLAKLASRVDHPSARVLRQWDGILSRDTIPGALYSIWMQTLLTEFFKPRVKSDELLKFVRGGAGVEVMLSALEQPDRTWFGNEPEKERDRLLASTFTKACQELDKLLPGEPTTQRWGRLHTATFTHPLAVRGPEFAKAFNLDPVERGGDGTTPNNARYDEHYHQVHGASYRQLFDLSDWDKALATSVPGQSGQPGSPHYGDLLPLWAETRYFSLPFTRKKVEEMTTHRLLLKPRAK